MPRAYDQHQIQAMYNPLNRPVAEAVPHYVKDMSEFLFNILKQVFEAEVKFFINGILGIIGMATEPVKWVEPIIGVLPSTKQIIQALTGISDGDWQDLVDWANKIEETAGDAMQLVLDIATLKSFEQINQDAIKLFTDLIKAISGFTQDPGTIVKAVHDHITNVLNPEADDLQQRMTKILAIIQDIGADVTAEGKESQDSFENARQLINELNTNLNRIINAIASLDKDITTTSRGGNMVIDYVTTAVSNLGGAINTVNSDVVKISPLVRKITVNMDGKDDLRQLISNTDNLTSPVAQYTAEIQSLPNRARVAGSDGAAAANILNGFGELAQAADDLAKNVDKMIRDFFNDITGTGDGTSATAADVIANIAQKIDGVFKDWNDFLGGLFGQGGTPTATGNDAAEFIQDIKKFVDDLGKLVGNLMDAITGVTGSATKDVADIMNHLKNAVQTAQDNAQKALKIMADAAAGILDDANAAASDLLKAMEAINKIGSDALNDLGNLLDGITGKKGSTPADASSVIAQNKRDVEAEIAELKTSSRTLPFMQNAHVQEFKSNGTWQNPSPKTKIRIGFICINAGARGADNTRIVWVNTGGPGAHGGFVYREYYSTDLPETIPVTIGKGGQAIGDSSLISKVDKWCEGRNGVSYWANAGFYVELAQRPGSGGATYNSNGEASIMCDGGKNRGNLGGPGGDGQSLPSINDQKGEVILCGGGGGAAGYSGIVPGTSLGGNGGWPGGGGGYPYGTPFISNTPSGYGADGVVWVLTFKNEDH